MQHDELKAIVESLMFAAQEPLSIGSVALVLGEAGVEKAAIAQAVDALVADYQSAPHHGLELVQVAEGYQFRTKPALAGWIARLNMPKPVKLSQAAMEALAIIAYRQPLIRADMEDIRGVDCGGVLKTLLERNLIKIVGKRDEPGSPLLYGTTTEFLSMFNLGTLSDLPSLKEYHELEQRQSAQLPLTATELAAAPEISAPLHPIDATVQVALERDDQAAIDELESQIRSLRHLEHEIFPDEKPVDAIDTALAALANRLDNPVPDNSDPAPSSN